MAPDAGTESFETLLAIAVACMPGGISAPGRALDPPVLWSRASGARLFDAGGNAYLDFHAASGAVLLGHCYPAVNRRAAGALETFDLAGCGVTELEILLCRKLITHIPSAERVLLCGSGGEAVRAAVLLARAATLRPGVIRFEGSRHVRGDTHPAAGLTLPFNRLEPVEEALEREKDQVAAILLEPIPHEFGCIPPRLDFLRGLSELAEAYGALLIFDEVVTGFRHGLGGYQQYCGVRPHLTALGNSMANGFPIGALCGRAELMDRFPGGAGLFRDGTFNGHPAAAAAALAVIEELEDGMVHEYLFRKGAQTARALEGIIERTGIRAHVSQFGSVFTVYFLEPPLETHSDLLRNDMAADAAFRREMLQRGFIFPPEPLRRCHITASHTHEDLDLMLEAAESVLEGLPL